MCSNFFLFHKFWENKECFLLSSLRTLAFFVQDLDVNIALPFKVVTNFLDPFSYEYTSPTNNKLRTNFLLSSDAEILLLSTDWAQQIVAKCAKACMQCVHIPTELPFCMPPIGGWESGTSSLSICKLKNSSRKSVFTLKEETLRGMQCLHTSMKPSSSSSFSPPPPPPPPPCKSPFFSISGKVPGVESLLLLTPPPLNSFLTYKSAFFYKGEPACNISVFAK